MQEWVFDRDGARTGRDPGATAGQPVPGAPAPAGPRRARPGRRGRWVVAAGAALAVLTGGVAVAAATPDTAPVATASDGSAVPQTPQTAPRTGTLPDADATDEGTTGPGTTEDDTSADDTSEEGTATAPSAPWSALHEEREVQQRDGTTLTVALQGGTVTGLTGDSVTVESSDGYSRSYAVTAATRIATPSGTLADLAAGDAVLVEAVVEGDTATAATIRTAPSTGGGTSAPAGGSEQDTSGDEA